MIDTPVIATPWVTFQVRVMLFAELFATRSSRMAGVLLSAWPQAPGWGCSRKLPAPSSASATHPIRRPYALAFMTSTPVGFPVCSAIGAVLLTLRGYTLGLNERSRAA